MRVIQTTTCVVLLVLGAMGTAAWADSAAKLRQIETLLEQNKPLPDADKAYIAQNPDKIAAYLQEKGSQDKAPEFAKNGRTAVAKMIALLPKGQKREELAREMLDIFTEYRMQNFDDSVGAALELVQAEPKAVRAFLNAFQQEAKEAKTPEARLRLLTAPEGAVDAVIAAIARSNRKDFLPELKALRDSTSNLTRPDVDYVISYLEGRFPPRQFRHDSADALAADLVAFLKAHPDIPQEQLGEFYGLDRKPERLAQVTQSRARFPKRWQESLEPYRRLVLVPADKWTKTDVGGPEPMIAYDIPGERPVEVLMRQEPSGEWILHSVKWAPM
jgi:hypothetical protein